MSGEYVISSVLSQHNKNLKLWTSVTAFRGTSVTAQFYLESKGKYFLEAWGHTNPKDAKRRESERERARMVGSVGGERENEHVQEREQAPLALWLLFLYVFFFFLPIWQCIKTSSTGDLPNPEIEPSLLHCRQILYQLSYKRNPRILEWVAYTFSRGSSRPRNQTGVSCIANGFLTNWTMREALNTNLQCRRNIEKYSNSLNHQFYFL